MGQLNSFLRRVASGGEGARGPDGGYHLPENYYVDIVGHIYGNPDGSLPSHDDGERVFCIAPFANQELRGGSDYPASILIRHMVETLQAKVGRSILRTRPLELEASGEASYQDASGSYRSAFANDETIFRLSVRVPAADATNK